jgi:cytochrome c oxidase subunit 2
MRLRVVAEPAAEFDAWQAHQATPAAAPQEEAAVHGARVFRERTCVACHTIGSSPPGVAAPHIAPDLTHLASRATLAAGAIENSPATLTRWIEDPDAIKPGSHMPNLHLSPAEVSYLVAYFEMLR